MASLIEASQSTFICILNSLKSLQMTMSGRTSPPGCCSNLGWFSRSIRDCYGADELARNERSKSIARPPSVSPIVILAKKWPSRYQPLILLTSLTTSLRYFHFSARQAQSSVSLLQKILDPKSMVAAIACRGCFEKKMDATIAKKGPIFISSLGVISI